MVFLLEMMESQTWFTYTEGREELEILAGRGALKASVLFSVGGSLKNEKC